MEYIFGGCRLNLHVAIDFTASNGPIDKGLHQITDVNQNQYIQALRSVGGILQYYDSDKSIPAYGFGALLPEYTTFNKTYHKFALNGLCFNPECNGISEVEKAYMNALHKTTMHGPTNFAEILDEINDRLEICEVSKWNQEYHVLMILTDGCITDLQNTVDEIVRGSAYNLSIIIVGVGTADFSQMDQLDADVKPLYSKKYKKYMERDIVQFVPFQ